jgi:hypothetical protein
MTAKCIRNIYQIYKKITQEESSVLGPTEPILLLIPSVEKELAVFDAAPRGLV